MADKAQFGGHKAPQFGDRISPGGDGFADGGHCAQCEGMLTDALDGTLSAADQAAFDAHLALCEPCSALLADAKRGTAWLEMLRDPRPEPPAALLERILAQTTGVQRAALERAGSAAEAGGANESSEPKLVFAPRPAVRSNVLPFRTRFAAAVRGNYFGHAMLQPRLAMTAAMAFFSIALTLNLTGVHVSELRPADLKPSSIKRDFYSANARVVQYYEGLRVVYELESRVHDLETDSATGSGSADTPGNATPAATPAQSPGTAKPESSPAGQQPRPEQQAPRKSPGPGSSRREALNGPTRLLALGLDAGIPRYGVRERGAQA